MKMNAKAAGMPERYWDASLSNLKIPNKYHNPLNEWMKKPQHTLILAGTPGTGKTYVCAAFLNDSWCDKEVRFFRDDDLYMMAKNAMQRNHDGCKEILIKCEVKHLIIDDLGVDEVTPYKLQCTERLVDYRYSKGENVATLITTNLNAQQIKEKYSNRIYSRLFSSQNKLIIFEGYDLRGKAEEVR